MKKNNVRIKENISFVDIMTAIESIVPQYFTHNEVTGEIEYTPYYSEIATKIAIVSNFMDGVEFEDKDDVYPLVMSDEEIMNCINKFYFNIENTKEAEKENAENELFINIMNMVMTNVEKMVNFKKEKLIHEDNDMKEYLASMSNMFNSFEDFLNVMANSLRTFSNLNLSKITPEMMEMAQKFAIGLKDKNITPDILTDVIKDAVAFDMDKVSADIIDSKNKQIKELKSVKSENVLLKKRIVELEEYKKNQESRNVKINIGDK